ncbi:MAG TPA: SpoIIE family protein phosphatase [Polyangiaceae bacterium]|jgi:hypothetical protein
MDSMRWTGSAGEILDWAAAGQPITGQAVSGDLHLVAPFSVGVLIAVIDGLGHGPDAQKAARVAVEVLLRDPALPVEKLVARCHEELGRLRGAVMSLASFDATEATMTWIGVGNVEGVLLRRCPAAGQARHERLLLWGGIVGQTLPKLRPWTLSLGAGDTVVLATDGVRTSSLDDTRTSDTVEGIANGLLARHARGTDDALVVAARYRGGAL